jgi:hypothetical protein
MNITEILLYLVPDAEFIVRGNTYDGIEWLDERAKPTLEEIEVVNIEEIELNRWRQTEKVDMWKLEQALDDWGVLDEIEASLPHFPIKVQRAWKKSKDARRNSPAVEGLRQYLNTTYDHINITQEDVDQIFKNAEQVEL